MHLRQRRHLYRIVGDESGLDERALTGLAEDLVDQFAFAHMFRVLYAEFLGFYADLVFAHICQVQTGLLFDGIEDRQTAVRCFEIHLMITDLHFGRTVDGDRDAFQQLLREAHHPVIILVLHVQLHAGELGVVVSVHTFVTEVTADLIHTLQAAYDQALEVQFGRDTQIHIYVERVMMGNERTGTRTACYLLQDRGLHLRVARFIEYLTHGAQDRRAFEERIFDTLIHHQVHITLAVTLLGVVESVVGYTVFVFDDRQRTQTLGKHRQLLGMHGYLTHLRAEYETFNADEIAYIEQFLENDVVHLLLYGRRLFAFGYRCLYVISRYIHLNTSFGVLDFDERGLTHDTLAHQTTGDTNFVTRVPDTFTICIICIICIIVHKMLLDVGRITGYFILGSRVRVDAHLTHGLQTLPTNQFLFT